MKKRLLQLIVVILYCFIIELVGIKLDISSYIFGVVGLGISLLVGELTE